MFNTFSHYCFNPIAKQAGAMPTSWSMINTSIDRLEGVNGVLERNSV
jgi:hypothetical protein